LSTVETIGYSAEWQETKEFIVKYVVESCPGLIEGIILETEETYEHLSGQPTIKQDAADPTTTVSVFPFYRLKFYTLL
jgi:hypothetical protein